MKIDILFNISLNFEWGVIGSIIATVISELSVTGYQLFAIRKQISFQHLFKDWYKYSLAGLIMFIIVLWMNVALPMSWAMMILEILTGIVVYMVLIFVMRANVFGIIRKMIKDHY